MDFALGEEAEALRALAQRIFGDLATPERLKAIEAAPQPAERMDRALWGALAKAGLLGASLPEAHGGSGLGGEARALLLQEAGRTAARVPLHATLAAGALGVLRFGSAAQRERLLPAVARGEAVWSAALAEADEAGVAATREADAWRLRGALAFVPEAPHADRLLVPARTAPGAIGLFALDARAEGVRCVPQEATSGALHGAFALEDARVPEADALGPPEGGAPLLHALRLEAACGLCALQLGACEEALRLTAEHLRERRQFGRPIGSFQAVHQRAADAYIDLEAMRLTLWRAVHRLARGREAEDAVAVAKYWAAEGGARVTAAAQHLHGGIGLDLDYPLHRYYTLARELGVSLGGGPAWIARLGERLADPSPDEV